MPATVKKQLGNENTIKVDPKQEYLSGGELAAYGTGYRVLPSSTDERVSLAHSAREYEMMLADPKISKAVNLLKISALSDGVELLPAVPEVDEAFEDAVAVADFCNLAIKQLETPLRYTLEQLMDALIYGHQIAEITYKTTEMRGFKGQFLVPEKIKVKPYGTVRFVIDNKVNVIGLVARALAQGTNNGDPAGALKSAGKPKITNVDGRPYLNGQPILPRSKFMVFTFRGKNSDPRGQSILASSFNAWHLKTTVWPEYLRYLLLCSIPLLVGYTPEDDTMIKEILRDATGKPVIDQTSGMPVEVNPVQALRDAMLNARNAEVLAVKGGSKIQEIGAQGAGTPFFKAIELFDSQIEQGILQQTLATSEGIHQNRAASTMHMSILDQLIWWLKGIVTDMLVEDLLRPMVRFNFGDDALDLTPKVSLGDTERREFATDAAAIATLFKSGYFQPEQLKQADAMLGLFPRRTIDPMQLVQSLQSAGVKIAAVPPPPEAVAEIQAGPGGGSTPVDIEPATGQVPTGATPDSAQSTSRTINRSGNVRFPASGRVKAKINASPKNSQIADTVNVKP